MTYLRADKKGDEAKENVIWTPNPGPQEYVLGCSEYEILYGGARGGGKTDAGIVFMTYDTDNPRLRGLVIRKNAKDLSDWIDRARQMYTPLGAKLVGSQKPEFRWPSGALIRTGHLKDENAFEQYQGHEYQRMLIEELTQIATEENYIKLVSSCRSTTPNLPAQIFNTTNPGGRGHVWVRKRFVDTHPKGGKSFPDPKSGRMRIFIKSNVNDTPQLVENDPGYIAFLQSLPENLRKAWYEGDWDVLAGTFFSEWNKDMHVVSHTEPHMAFRKIRATDYGRNAPFVTLWGVVGFTGHVYWYREYMAKGKDADENAYLVGQLSKGEEYWIDVIDPSVFADTGHGHTIGQILQSNGMPTIEPATKKSKSWRKHRWGIMHEYLRWDDFHNPQMTFSERCTYSIGSIPDLQVDDKDIEDLDCFVAGTMISTFRSSSPIELIENGEMVWTPVGYRRAYKVGEPVGVETVKVEFANGKSLQGTSTHKVMVVGKGLVALRDLECSDILMEKTICHKKLFTKVLGIESIRVDDIMSRMEAILQRGIHPSIARFLLILSAPSLKVFMSIIKIIIRIIILLTIWRLWKPENMRYYTTLTEKTLKRSNLNGLQVKQVNRFYLIMLKRCLQELLSGNFRAAIVAKMSRLSIQQRSTVMVVSGGKVFPKALVRYVISLFGLRKMVKKQLKHVRIVAVGNSGVEKVYKLRVEQAHLYCANGILVTNTDGEDHAADASSYGLSELRERVTPVPDLEERRRRLGWKGRGGVDKDRPFNPNTAYLR